MSERTVKLLLIAAASMALVWALIWAWEQRPSESEEDPLTVLLEAVDADAVEAVHLSGRGTEPVLLAKNGERWTVNGLPADSARVARFWEQLRAARVLEEAARSPENHARLGVDADSARVVVFERAGAADTLLLGKDGPSPSSFFARLPGDDRVYRVGGDLRSAVPEGVEGWRNRRVAALDTMAVLTVTVAREDGPYVLSRSDSVWTVDGAAADATLVSGLLVELSKLDASGFPDEAALVDARPPERTLTATGADGEVLVTLRLWEVGEGATIWLIEREGDPTVYEFPTWRTNRLAPQRASLLAGASGEP